MNPNDLLLSLSAKGSGTWSRFRAAVDELQSTEDTNGNDEDLDEGASDANSFPIHHRLRLNLERLAHAEFRRRDCENGWRIVPPALASVEHKNGVSAFLCGARTDLLMEQIKSASEDLDFNMTSQADCPDRIEIGADSNIELKRVAKVVGLRFAPRAGRVLLCAVPPIDDWQLKTVAELPFGGDWEVHQFSARTLGWLSATADEARSVSFGLFRFQVRYQPQYYIRARDKEYRLPVQLGKYLVLKRSRRHVVAYDVDMKTLSVPVSCRPPLLVDRALTLCSGLIPQIESGRLVYQNVSKATAVTTASLLRQKL